MAATLIFLAVVGGLRTDQHGETKVTFTVAQNQRQAIAALPFLAERLLEVTVREVAQSVIGGKVVSDDDSPLTAEPT